MPMAYATMRTSSGTTARPNADALASRPVQVLLHDQEVRRKALLDDDAHLVFGTHRAALRALGSP